MMTPEKRYFWILTLFTFLVMTSGCARTIQRYVEDEIVREGTGIYTEKGQSVRGYLLQDGTWEDYQGWVRVSSQDSLAFWSESDSEEMGHQGVKKKIKVSGPVYALTAVKALELVEYDHTGLKLFGQFFVFGTIIYF
jgi:hypothetical protein